MWHEDQDKTFFITEKGQYGWLRIAFWPQGCSIHFPKTDQHGQLATAGKNTCMEAYIDDMIMKSQQEEDHIGDLRETFETLRKYMLKLNPKKYIFGVLAGKLLGFLVDKRGIKANRVKIQAILDMKSTSKIKEVQHLTGCLPALGYFLSKLGDKCHNFFAIIKKKDKFE